MKYDDASWHYGGDFPAGMPAEAGATHIGMFVAWCMLNGLAGQLHTDEFPDDLEALKSRSITPGQFVVDACDEKFTDEELTDEGNSFALAYFGDSGGMGKYISDYEEMLSKGEPTLYHISDTWENYDKLAPVIERRYSEWKNGKLSSFDSKDFDLAGIVEKKPWWKFW
jgi:hypothetical protein